MWTRRRFLKALGALPLAGFAGAIPTLWGDQRLTHAADGDLTFSDGGQTDFGDWRTDVAISPALWQPGTIVHVDLFLHLAPSYIASMVGAGYAVDTVLMLATSERCFDPSGWLRLPGDERMSTLLTPAGLAIEGGNSGAISKSLGSRFRNPVDQLKRVAVADLQKSDSSQYAHYVMDLQLPADTPPGIYRLRFDFGVVASRRYYSLNAEGFANRPRFPAGKSMVYSPPIPCNGLDQNGNPVDATQVSRRLYWVLLGQYNSNGYSGVVADEDQGHFALSDRNIIPDEVILPLYDGGGNRLSYSLEPDFRADVIDELRNIPWNFSSGELSIQVTDPSGETTDLGTLPFLDKKGHNPTTRNPKFTSWKPAGYGRYTVVAKGWIADRWGNRYQGGGSYHFWIAKRMTMATATFQGQAYPVGTKYGRDIGFAPTVPADVTITATLYPNSSSEPSAVKTLTYSGKATPGGIFGVAQGMKPFTLDTPGEYHAHTLATYTDADNHLWVCSMRHAGVVYPPDSNLIAHGKMVKVGNALVERGDTNIEGFVQPNDGFRNLDHINFPYNAGDLLLIASEGDGANKIEPVMTYEIKDSGQKYDPRLQPIGNTNVRIVTSNGMSPHLYPEYITDLAYYYGAGPRPGFMSRFLVGEDGVRAPYWPTSATNFGGQFGTTANGDMPGTIYRLLGGVVLRPKEQTPLYAGYIASAFILPKGSNNNRVIAPGSEDLLGADGQRFRVFLVSLRPGMVYEPGTAFAPVFQIDPILPIHIHCALKDPDGNVVKEWDGNGDGFGYFVGADRVTLDRPGLWIYTVQSDWQGYPGHVPGLPDEGGHIYVIDKPQPAGRAGLKLALKNQQSFKVEDGLTIDGFSNADEVYFAAVTPGCVVDQGQLSVDGGRFVYKFDPAAIHQRVPIYDTQNLRNGKLELGRIIHLTFFARQKAADGTPYYAFARVIFRGNSAIYSS